MKLIKVLNNNVIIALNEDGEEVILMGNGLGFQMKANSNIRTEKIEKVFKLANKVQQAQVEKLLAEIPEEIIQIAYDIVQYAKKTLDKDFSDTALLAIADHLHAAIQRYKNGIQVKNFLLWDVKRFFPEEYHIGQTAISKVNHQFQTNLAEDEAGFIALHIANASFDNNGYQDAVSLTQLIEEILTVIKYTLRTDFSENDIHFQRFLTHLKFFSQQVLANQAHHEPANQVENDLFLLITKQYPEAYEVTKKVAELLKIRRNYLISKDEQVYITIHLARIMEKTNN